MSKKHDHDHRKHHHHRHVAAMSEPIITVRKNGPYHIRGKVNIVTADGNVVETAGQEIWLCRCGQSPNKPFCDGTHERADFQSDLDAGFTGQAPEGYEDVCAEQDLPEGEVKGLKIGGNPILLGRVGGQFYAIGGICTHKQVLIEDGELDGWVVRCQRHDGGFDIRTGKAVRPPAVTAVPTYEVKVEGGRVLVSRGSG